MNLSVIKWAGCQVHSDLSLWCPEKSQMMMAYFVPRVHAICCEYRITSEHVPDSFKTKCTLFGIEKQAHLDDLRKIENRGVPWPLNIIMKISKLSFKHLQSSNALPNP